MRRNVRPWKAFKIVALPAVIGLLTLQAVATELRDVPYSSSAEVQLTFDAHIPDGTGPFPAAILVHGGGWVAGDKQQYINYLFKPLADAGFAWFSINYRLAPKYRFPAPAEDVQRAVRFIRSNAFRYKVDPNRLALIGESAGGHLVSYVGVRNRRASRVAAVVAMYGIHDFVTACQQWKPVPDEVFKLFGISTLDSRSRTILRKASPINYVSGDAPPFLLIHGSRDEDVPYAQSVEMCDSLKKARASCELITIEGAPHGMDHWESHPEFLWYKAVLVEWLRKTVH